MGSIKVNVSYIKSSSNQEGGEKVGGGGSKVGKNESLSSRLEKNRMKLKMAGSADHDDDMHGMGDFPSLISAVIPSLSDAAIRLNGKELTNVFESGGHIANSLKEFYVNEGEWGGVGGEGGRTTPSEGGGGECEECG